MSARVARLLLGAAFGWPVLLVLVSPEAPLPLKLTALALLILSAWRADLALVVLAGLTPAGLIIAAEPARAAETLAWAFLAGWMIPVWRPLAREWPARLTVPAATYALIAIGSWLALTIRETSTLDRLRLPLTFARSIARDHLLYSSPEPETWTLLLVLTGVALLIAAATLAAEYPRLALRVCAAQALSMAALSVLTLAVSVRDWTTNAHAAWFLERRFAFHLQDLNAAGSQYVLAGLIAMGLAWFDRPRRLLWATSIVLMVPGAWFAGSRTAALSAGAIVVGALVVRRGLERRWRPTRARVTGLATAGAIVLLASVVILARGVNGRDTAGSALRMRLLFAETSVRMTESAPVYGVGVGRYHGRSHEFMPPALRAVYGYENAHNYFAQQFAELGVIGGAAFLWLLGAGLRRGSTSLAQGNRLAAGLLAGSAGYLLTCVTGHPLLVAEASLPFWIVLGTVSGTAITSSPASPGKRPWVIALAVAVLVAVPVVSAATTSRTTEPVERGFYNVERTEYGALFRWTTRHAITYTPSGSGFIRLTVQAQDGDMRPCVLEIEIDGIRAERRILDDDDWHTIDVPARPGHRSTATHHRVDLRVDHVRNRIEGSGLVEPLGVMVSEIRWVPAR